MKSMPLFVTDNVLEKYTDFPSTKLSLRHTCIIIIIIIISQVKSNSKVKSNEVKWSAV